MGQFGSNQNSSSKMTEIQYYQTVMDRQFGKTSIYSSLKKYSSYIAEVHVDQQNSKIYNTFQRIQNAQLPSLAHLHAFQIKRTKYMAGSIKQNILAYWQYYNYYLQDHLNLRHMKSQPLSEKQIWYIIKVCCQSFIIFEQHGLIMDLDMSKIVLVPEGKIKLYWHHIQYDNQHLKYLQNLNMGPEKLSKSRSSVENNKKFNSNAQQNSNYNSQNYFYFSPQELYLIQNRQRVPNLDFDRANSWRLGMIILYCITLNNPIKTCYNMANSSIKTMVLNSLISMQIESNNRYSVDLRHLIRLLLQQEPSKRIPVSCILKVYQSFIEEDGQLNMAGGSQSPIQKIQKAQMQHQIKLNLQTQKSSLHQNSQQMGFNQGQIFQSKHVIQKMFPQPQARQNHSSVLSGGRQRNISERNQYQHFEKFDKFDTKTIKRVNTNSNKR